MGRLGLAGKQGGGGLGQKPREKKNQNAQEKNEKTGFGVGMRLEPWGVWGSGFGVQGGVSVLVFRVWGTG